MFLLRRTSVAKTRSPSPPLFASAPIQKEREETKKDTVATEKEKEANEENPLTQSSGPLRFIPVQTLREVNEKIEARRNERRESFRTRKQDREREQEEYARAEKEQIKREIEQESVLKESISPSRPPRMSQRLSKSQAKSIGVIFKQSKEKEHNSVLEPEPEL